MKYFEPKQPIPGRVYIATSISAGILIFGAWCLLAYNRIVDPDFLPTPDQVALASVRLTLNGLLYRNAAASFMVVVTGFVLSSLFAVPIGILMGAFKIVEAFVEPGINFTRYLPVSALIPLLILWIGIDASEKIAVIFIGAFFQQVLLIADVAAAVPMELLDVGYTLGAKRRHVILRILLPAVLPGVIDALRVSMGLAWTYLVVAELVGASEGLGYFIMTSMRGLRTDYIFVGIVTIGLLGLVMDQLFKLLRKIAVPWASLK